MCKRRFHRSWLALVLSLAAALFQAAPVSAQTTPNLLVNGDAEVHRCTNDWTAQTSIPGWRVVRGAASVLCYSAFNFARERPVTPTNMPAGNALFGAPGADTAIEQIVDVSGAAAAIDGGTVGV